MSHLPGEQILPCRGPEQIERTIDMPRLEAPRPDHLQLFARYRVRIERNAARVSVLSEHDVFGTVAAVLEAFIDSFWMSHTLYYYVRTIPAGFVNHSASPLGGVGNIRDIDHYVGPELLRHVQPVSRPADDDSL